MFNNDTVSGRRMNNILTILAVVLIAFLAVKTIATLHSDDYKGGAMGMKTITVSGKGEIVAVPDIATVTFAVVEQAKTVNEAQTKATAKMDTTLAALKALGIEEKDIKTTDYNAYPRYEYFQQVCTQFSCPPSGGQTIVGYEVRQSIMVKIRKIDDAGKILGEIGKAGVSDISGLTFTVDNYDDRVVEARKDAIDDAKAQAKKLAGDLGVRLGDIVSFSESGGGYPVPMYMSKDVAYGMGGAMSEAANPQIPTGENKIISNVMITYEIRD